MKQVLIYIITALLSWYNGYGQTDQKKAEKPGEKNVPKSNITVNKEYDENGNLISYDSTYSWSYSNVQNDTILNDTAIYGNREFFDHRDFFPDVPFFDEDFFNHRFLGDSLFYDRSFMDDFFNDRFFSDRFYGDKFSNDSTFFQDPPALKHFSPDQFFIDRESIEKMFRQIDSQIKR